MDSSTRFFWAASYGQIYPELRRLEAEGLIAGEDSPNGGRERRAYKLTAAGRKALTEWLLGRTVTIELRDESLLRLFFADALPREQALGLLEGASAATRSIWRFFARSTRGPATTRSSSTSSCAGESPSTNGEHSGARSSWSDCRARRRRLRAPTFWGVLMTGLPGFLREGFLPLGAFYAGLKLDGLVAGIVAATLALVLIYLYERKFGRDAVIVRISLGFVVVQGIVGHAANSTTVYLAQPVLLAAAWGLAFWVSIPLGRPLAGVLADAWYPFPRWLKENP